MRERDSRVDWRVELWPKRVYMQGEVAGTSTKYKILATPVNPERSIYAHPRNINRSNFGFDISEFRVALFHIQSLQPILLVL